MGKEQEIFEGFDLFSPVAKLKTPNPDEAEHQPGDVKITSTATQEEIDRQAALDFEKNLELSKKKDEDLKKKPKEAMVESSDKTTGDKTADKPVETPSEDFSFKPIVSYLAEKGIIDLEDKELESLADDESAIETVIGKTIMSNVDKGIQSYKDTLPEEAQDLLKFIELGGKPKDFYDVYYGNTSFETLDIKSEDNQRFVVREALKLSGWEADQIEDELKDYEDLGKLEAKSQNFLKRLQSYEKDQKVQLIKQQEANTEVNKKKASEYWEGLKSELNKKEDILGFKVTPKVKEDLWNFIATPSKKTGKTALQEHNETNKDSQFLYAYLAMKNFDITTLEKAATTKVASELRSKLGKFTDSRQKLGGARDNQREDDNVGDAFSGFEKIMKK